LLSAYNLPQEVRDECRIDPAISKNILIEIAKSKQQRGMLSLYNKYKAQKLSKEQIKTEARRDRKTKAEQTVNILGTMQTKISAVTFDDLTTEDRNKVIAALETLKLTIEDKLSGLCS